MNPTKTRGTPRNALSFDYGAARARAMNASSPVGAVISQLELRRLVAEMID